MTLPLAPVSPVETNDVPGGADIAAPTWLDLRHQIYELRKDFWERQERLYMGGPTMREMELFKWETEAKNGPHITMRLGMASYLGLGKKHAQMTTGHLRRKAPVPGKGYDFGSLGEVRPRTDYRPGTATLAETLWYNCDGVGSDGSQFPVFFDTVSDWSQATGYRWVMCEMPAFQGQGTPSDGDVKRGLHPYFVHLSPLDVPLWWDRQGQLEFAVLRVPVDEPDLTRDYIPHSRLLGYYLVVRNGCTLLGNQFQSGGWWIWDSQKNFVATAPWSHPSGEIPMWQHISIPDPGTREEPNIGASQTEELNQIDVAIMNLSSARDSDVIDAAESKMYVLGADAETMGVIQKTSQGQLVAVPAVARQQSGADGGVTFQIPTIYDGSMGAVTAEVFTTVLTSKLELAQQIMLNTVSSTPDSSGRSKEAGFSEGSSPLLARMASTREQSENAGIYFYQLRSGKAPDGSVEWPKEFDLAPMVEDIDAMFDTLRRAEQTTASPTLNEEMVMQALDERQINLDPATRAKVIAEFRAKAAAAQAVKDAVNSATITAATGKNPDGTPVEPAAGGNPAGGSGGNPPPPKPRALALAPAPNPLDEGTT